MKKNVFILNHYASGMMFSNGGRHYWFAKYLKRQGYAPVVFGCNVKGDKNEYYFDIDGIWTEKEAEEIQVPFVFVKSSLYTGNGKSRIKNMYGFYHNVQIAAKEYAKSHSRPDIILASSVHPLTLLAGIKLAKHFGVKCICEVRDLWPESIIAFNESLSKESLLAKCLYQGEKYLYKRADTLLFTFEGGYDYIRDKGWDKTIPKEKTYYVNNGIDLEVIEKLRDDYHYEDDDLDNPDIYKIVYTGSIRKVNNVGTILDLARLVKTSHIRFLIWGDGNEAEGLKQRVKDEGITNVIFKGKVEKTYIPSIVRRADLNYLHFKATEMDYKYGISPNKLFDYFAAGKPILCDVPTKYNPMLQEDAGFSTKEGSTLQEIAALIDQITNLTKEEYEQKAKNAQIAADKYDFSNLTLKLIDIIEKT